jgi:hypothetical protein
LTCGFGVRFADLAASTRKTSRFPLPRWSRAYDLRFSRVLTEAVKIVYGRPCTGSCDDPEILAFLDRPRPDGRDLAGRAVIERVEPDLVLHWVDQIARTAPDSLRVRNSHPDTLSCTRGPYPDSSVATSSRRRSSAMS